MLNDLLSKQNYETKKTMDYLKQMLGSAGNKTIGSDGIKTPALYNPKTSLPPSSSPFQKSVKQGMIIVHYVIFIHIRRKKRISTKQEEINPHFDYCIRYQ